MPSAHMYECDLACRWSCFINGKSAHAITKWRLWCTHTELRYRRRRHFACICENNTCARNKTEARLSTTNQKALHVVWPFSEHETHTHTQTHMLGEWYAHFQCDCHTYNEQMVGFFCSYPGGSNSMFLGKSVDWHASSMCVARSSRFCVYTCQLCTQYHLSTDVTHHTITITLHFQPLIYFVLSDKCNTCWSCHAAGTGSILNSEIKRNGNWMCCDMSVYWCNYYDWYFAYGNLDHWIFVVSFFFVFVLLQILVICSIIDSGGCFHNCPKNSLWLWRMQLCQQKMLPQQWLSVNCQLTMSKARSNNIAKVIK